MNLATEICAAMDRIQHCIEETHRLHTSWRHQLNLLKTEIIWFGLKTNLKKLQDMDLALRVRIVVIQPVKVVRVISVYCSTRS